jgi:hypothetical protein
MGDIIEEFRDLDKLG